MATVEVWTNPSPSWLSGQARIDGNSMCEVAKPLEAAIKKLEHFAQQHTIQIFLKKKETKKF